MKTIAFAVVAFSVAAFSQSASACLGEAQIITKVASSSAVSAETCLVKIQPASFFNESLVCPLDYATVVETGILVSASTCPASDAAISGIVVLRADGSLVLE